MSKICIRVAESKDEREATIQRVKEKYLEYYGTTPSVSDLYIAAWQGDTLVGTIGMDFLRDDGTLPIHHLYEFNFDQFPKGSDLSTSVQVGRWTSSNKLISLPLVCATALYGLRRGKEYAWIEQTPPSHQALQRGGITFHDMTQATLLVEKIPQEDIPYYQKEPRPQCYIMDFMQIRKAVEPYIASNCDVIEMHASLY
jgi:hypothetical protein